MGTSLELMHFVSRRYDTPLLADYPRNYAQRNYRFQVLLVLILVIKVGEFMDICRRYIPDERICKYWKSIYESNC